MVAIWYWSLWIIKLSLMVSGFSGCELAFERRTVTCWWKCGIYHIVSDPFTLIINIDAWARLRTNLITPGPYAFNEAHIDTHAYMRPKPHTNECVDTKAGSRSAKRQRWKVWCWILKEKEIPDRRDVPLICGSLVQLQLLSYTLMHPIWKTSFCVLKDQLLIFYTWFQSQSSETFKGSYRKPDWKLSKQIWAHLTKHK